MKWNNIDVSHPGRTGLAIVFYLVLFLIKFAFSKEVVDCFIVLSSIVG